MVRFEKELLSRLGEETIARRRGKSTGCRLDHALASGGDPRVCSDTNR